MTITLQCEYKNITYLSLMVFFLKALNVSIIKTRPHKHFLNQFLRTDSQGSDIRTQGWGEEQCVKSEP